MEGFVGTWQEESKEGFDEMAKKLQLPQDKIDLYKTTKTSISYGKKGDDAWEVCVGVLGAPNGKRFEFKLGQEYDSEDLDGSKMKSLIAADGPTLMEKHINEGLNGVEMNIKRWIEGDTMMVETKCSGESMLSKYKKA